MTDAIGHDSSRGLIANAPEFDKMTLIDVAIFIRVLRSRHFLSREEIVNANVVAEADAECVIEFSPRNSKQVHQIRFLPESGMQISGYVGMSPNRQTFLRLINKDFRLVNGFSLPNRIECELFRPDGSVREKRVIDVSRIAVGEGPLDDRLFEIEWPLNSVVHDDRTKATVRVASKPQVLSDEVLREAAKRDYFSSRSDAKGSAVTLDRKGGVTYVVVVGINLLVITSVLAFVAWRRYSNRN